MPALSRSVTFALAVVLTGCAATTDESASDSESSSIIASEQSSRVVPSSAVKILMDDGVNFCTGVLVNESYALTEKHCVTNPDFPGWKTWTIEARGQRVVAERAAVQPASTIAILKLRQPVRARAYARLATARPGSTFRAFAVGRQKEERTSALVASKTLSALRLVPDGAFVQTRCYSAGGDSGGGLYLLGSASDATDVVVGFEHDPEGWCDNPDHTQTATLHDLFTAVTPDVVALVDSLTRPR